MNCLTSLCRYTASRRLVDVLGAMRGILFSHTSTAASVCPPPAPPCLRVRHPIQVHGLLFQHISRVISRRPPAVRLPTRHYCTFRPVTHSTHGHGYSRWYYYDPRKVAVATLPLIICIGGAVIADCVYIEMVPFTNRTHFVLRSPLEERELGESRFAYLKDKYTSIILDSHHPDSLRVNNITLKLVRAVHSHLIIKSHDTTVMLDRGNAGSALLEVLRRKLRNTWRVQPATGHLNGLKWEVVVVKDKRVTMWSYPAGKIIVPTGLLQVFGTDAEIAIMIAHEIGHVLARHWAEKIIYNKCLPVPFFRRVEREADQIGMMILAAAGFDPRVALPAFEKLEDSHRRLFSSHPLITKRSQFLSSSKIMKEALELYREVSPDQDTEGSLSVRF